MELKKLHEDKNSLEIEVIGETDTFLIPLQKKLLDHPEVKNAILNFGHPLLDNPKLFIEVKEGKKPVTILTKVARELIKEFESFEKELEKAWAKYENR